MVGTDATMLPEQSEAAVLELRRQVLCFVSVLWFFGSLLLLLWSFDRSAVSLPKAVEALSALVLLGLSVANFYLQRRFVGLVCRLLPIVSLLFGASLALLFHQEILLFFLPFAIMIAGLLLSQGGVSATALGGLVLVELTRKAGLPMVLAPAWMLAIVGTAGVALFAGKAMTLVGFWESELAGQQRAMIGELRARQGELNRTLKALDEAYANLKRANRELTIARGEADEARAMKEHFVANVSHELRTPLNLIVGFAEIMYLAPETYSGVGWTPELENDVHEMYRASRHLQSMVDDILDLSRIDAARLPMFRESCDLRSIITDAVETIAPLLRQRGLQYRVRWPDSLPQLWVDRTRIRQVLLNVLNNAARFTDEGEIAVSVEQTDESLVVLVQDTGVGIPREQLERIFEDFSQADGSLKQRGGTGLGLALSRRFVRLHGGRIWAESEPGQGSTFYVSLPLPGALPQTTSLIHIPDRARDLVSQAPIVVVDSDQTIGEMLARYLDDCPVITVPTMTEAEALVLKEHPRGIVVNQPPAASCQTWLGPLGDASRRYGVPILRCSIPSASWLQSSYDLDGCLHKPISRTAIWDVTRDHTEPGDVVLVVDDDPGFVTLVERMLSTLPEPRCVVPSYGGSQAVRLAREHHPRLVLLDLLMPETDGFAVLRALRHDTDLRDIAVVAVTATSYAEDAMLCQGSYFTVTETRGLSAAAVVELCNATLHLVRPDYVNPLPASQASVDDRISFKA